MGYRKSFYGVQVATLLKQAIRETGSRAGSFQEGTEQRVRAQMLRDALLLLHNSARRCDADWRTDKKQAEFRWFQKLIVFCLLLFSGCAAHSDFNGYEVYQEGPTVEQWEIVLKSTVSAWEQFYGPVSQSCINGAEDIFISVLPPQKVTTACKRDYYLWGCRVVINGFEYEENYIFISGDRDIKEQLETLIHEYIHYLLWCEKGVYDPNHKCFECWFYNANNISIEHNAWLELEKK